MTLHTTPRSIPLKIIESFFVSQSSSAITLLHQNIAGILNKQELLHLSIEDLANKIGNIDIICLTETFMKRGSESNLKLKKFKLAASYSRESERRGGSCILIKRHLDSKPIDLCVEPKPYVFEYCATEVLSINAIIVCIYRIPNSDINEFLQSLSSLMIILIKKKRKRIILCGDWNIDLLTKNTPSQRLQSILNNCNITQHILKPTRKKTCIDVIASNIPYVKAELHYMGLSDHETCQSITFDAPISTQENKLTYWFEFKRDCNIVNTYKFCECMTSLSFNDILDCTDTNIAFDSFHDTITLFYKLCFPLIKVKVTSNRETNCWITKGIKKCCVRKRVLYLTYRLHSGNKKTHKENYKKYNNLFKKCVNQAQRLSNSKYVINSKNKCKAAWNIIKKYSPAEKGNKPLNISNIKIDNIEYTNANQIADKFNKYFINLTNDKTSLKTSLSSDRMSNIRDSIFIYPTDDSEVRKVIMELNNTNSTGYDEINTRAIKLCSKQLSRPLSHIINLSILQGEFPTRLKYSVVKPVHKRGCKKDMNNYRPITLIPILSKIFEKVMYKRINYFISKNKLLKPEQFGFLKNSSTSLACFTLTKLITESLNQKMPVACVFLDMSKAFDLVSHKTLLNKLLSYGIRGNAHKWLHSYISNRNQCVQVTKIYRNTKKTYTSNYEVNSCGLPQGSILGPLLFLLYANDLPDSLNCKCVQFADDTTLIIQCKQKKIFEEEINQNLNNIVEWMNNNNLTLNVSKTKYIQFQTYNSSPVDIRVMCNSLPIEHVDHAVFLGVVLDKNVNWKQHIDTLCTKLDRFVYALYKLKKVTSQEAALCAYHGYVSSLLRYGLILWGNSVDVIRVFRVQKKCIRAICGAAALQTCKPLFKNLKLLPLPCLYIFEVALFVHKYRKHFPSAADLQSRSNRYPNKLVVPRQRVNVYKKNVYCMAIRIYNKLPENMKNLSTKFFKSKLFEMLLNKNFYTVREYFEDNMT